MFTSRRAAAPSASWSAAHVGAAIIGAAMIVTVMASIAAATSAHAGGISDTSCVGNWTNFNCVTRWGPPVDPYVRLVPQAVGATDQAPIIARERKWLARCRPVITHDPYGVARYRYAAPGCEFGVGED